MCPSASRFFLCPYNSGAVHEPAFPQYLDVLAPYVNQVNLIRAGVPKIVSMSHSAISSPRAWAGSRPSARWGTLLQGSVQTQGAVGAEEEGHTP